MKTDERKKVLELSKNWLREEVKNKKSAQPAVSRKASPHRKRLVFIIGVAALAFCIVVLINNLSYRDSDKQKNPVNPQSIMSQRAKSFFSAAIATPSSESVPSSSMVEQPAQNSAEKVVMPSNNYPSGWPDELHYPAQFAVQDANTVRTHDNALPAYAVQMRFDGDMQTASESLTSYFEKQGWQIVGRSELDSGAFKIDVARNGARDSGHIMIDPDPLDTGKVRIVAIVFF